MNIEGLPVDLFWSKVDAKDAKECWHWLGEKMGAGLTYGRFRFAGKKYYAHRLSYYLHYGEDPGSRFVCHSCDNPICCNPHHLWLGTNSENGNDKISKGRNPKGSTHGLSVLTEEKVSRIAELLKDSKLTFAEIGAMYGVSVEAVSSIRAGQTWKHVTGGRVAHNRATAKLNKAKASEIKKLLADGVSYRRIAPLYGVTPATVYDIWMGNTWKDT